MSTFRLLMNNKTRNRPLTLAAWLALPFILFILIFKLITMHTAWPIWPTVSFIFMPALFLAVLAIASRQADKYTQRFTELEQELATLKKENISLKHQLEENIEKRVYELQLINGALNREIAERIQAEEGVRDLQKQLSLILNSAGEGILGLDNKGRVTFLNTAASLMLGWEAEEIVGQKHHALIHHTLEDGSPHPVDQCPIYMAYRDGLVHYKTGDLFWCKNGSSFPVEYSSTPINDQGMLTGAVVVFRDMSTFQ